MCTLPCEGYERGQIVRVVLTFTPPPLGGGGGGCPLTGKIDAAWRNVGSLWSLRQNTEGLPFFFRTGDSSPISLSPPFSTGGPRQPVFCFLAREQCRVVLGFLLLRRPAS